MNTTSQISAAVLRKSKGMRFSALSGLTDLSSVARKLDAFEAGLLRDTVNIWDTLEQRDDVIRGVVSKRKKAVGRQGWTVLLKEDLDDSEREEAKRHAAAIEFFYENLRCEHAVDSAEQGGFKLLVRQMMDAVGKRFAVHEIVWRPQGVSGPRARTELSAPQLSATFRFVPLAFFENTTGELRFLETESAMTGRPLEPGAWMITVGEGLMMATTSAWICKNLSLNDWLVYSERNGRPGLRGISGSARGSDEWNALESSLSDVLSGGAVVHGTGDDIRVIDLAAGGHMPFPQFVDRMDRVIAALWRGADLSTLSRDRGYGASLQEKETYALEEDDAEMITETLNRYVDEWVIRFLFGEQARPLARVQVLVTPREWTSSDLQIDEFLIRHGAPVSIEAAMNRYGRALPKPGEKVFLSAISAEPRGGGASISSSSRKASLPESSQNSGLAQGIENTRDGSGPSVSFRGCSPSADENPRAEVAGAPGSLLPNEFALLEPEWLQLSPYGDFPHARGLQRINRAVADAMVQQFNSWRARAGRLFGGLPVYSGHPDLAGASELADRKAYGWILGLEAREDGLFGRAKWSDAGIELLRNAHFKFLSPYWEAREVTSENARRIYQPVALISVGLTNQPNLPVRPLANESRPPAAPERTESAPAFPELPMHTRSCTAALGLRRAELTRMQNRRDRIQEAVLAKMRLGLAYDQAWESVKREHSSWFEQ